MSHSYVNLKTFKSAGNTNIGGDDKDAALLRLVEGVSRQAEHITKRIFYPVIDTRYFSGTGQKTVDFKSWDLISVTSLLEDNNQDAVYEVTWATTDYILAPYENDPTSHANPRPYYRLEVDQRSTGNQDYFISGQQMYQLIGKFGYCELTESVTTINEGAEYAIGDTTLTVADPTDIGIGDTLVIESEYLYVTGQAVALGNDFTVTRGVNGSTAVAHADTTAVSKLVYPQEIVSAVVMQASRLLTRQSAGYSNQIGFSETGTAFPQLGLDQDVRQMLDPYKRYVVA